MEKIIKLSDIYKKYSLRAPYILKNINLEIKRGEFFALLGPNGSGKSTLLSIISGVIQPTKGMVYINNRPPNKAQEIIGFVPQDIALYEQLTLLENMRLFGRFYHLKGKELSRNIDDALERVKLKSAKNKLIAKFSGGMKRRANLAIAFIQNPEILILDEPTVGIDPISRNLILKTLKKLHKNGITIIYSTHYIEEAEKLCTKLAIMNEGKIIDKGSIKKLLKRNKDVTNLSELFLTYTGIKI